MRIQRIFKPIRRTQLIIIIMEYISNKQNNNKNTESAIYNNQKNKINN